MSHALSLLLLSSQAAKPNTKSPKERRSLTGIRCSVLRVHTTRPSPPPPPATPAAPNDTSTTTPWARRPVTAPLPVSACVSAVSILCLARCFAPQPSLHPRPSLGGRQVKTLRVLATTTHPHYCALSFTHTQSAHATFEQAGRVLLSLSLRLHPSHHHPLTSPSPQLPSTHRQEEQEGQQKVPTPPPRRGRRESGCSPRREGRGGSSGGGGGRCRSSSSLGRAQAQAETSPQDDEEGQGRRGRGRGRGQRRRQEEG